MLRIRLRVKLIRMEILLYYIAFCNVEDKAKDSEIKRN